MPKYLRAVLAYDGDKAEFDDRLIEFIDEEPTIVGAYISADYPTREEALGADFRHPEEEQ